MRRSFGALSCLVGFVVVSAIILSRLINYTFAELAQSKVNVSAFCTMTASGSSTHNVEIVPGNYTEIVSSPINVSCNDAGGYALYTIGYSGDSYTASNHTRIISSLNSNYDIPTNTSGTDSYWAMKVATSGTDAPTIDNSFGSYHQIAANFTRVSYFNNSTLGTNNSVTTPTYKVNVSSAQPAGTYEGKVKY